MDAADRDYYTALAGSLRGADGQPAGVEVAQLGGSRGKVVRATSSHAASATLWTESPLVGMTHIVAKKVHASCDECMRSVGTVSDEWQRCSGVLAAAAEEARKKKLKKSKGKKTKTSTPAANETEETTPVAEVHLPEVLPCLHESDASAVDASLASLECPAVPCTGGCSAVYCSTACRDTAWRSYHALLCGATTLTKHAASHNEAFFLAAKATAQMATRALDAMRAHPDTTRAFGEANIAAHAHPLTFALQLLALLGCLSSDAASSLRDAMAACVADAIFPYSRFCGSVWWEHVPLPAKVDPDDSDDYRGALCGLVEQAVERLHEHLNSQLERAATETAPLVAFDDLASSLHLAEIFSLAQFGRLLSSFELNNIGFHAPTALALYVQHIAALPTSQREAAVARIRPDAWSAMQSRVASLGSSLEGTGLFALACCMNHSCTPNVTLRQKADPTTTTSDAAHLLAHDTRLNRDAVFIALRDIEPGEELNISYIDLVQPVSAVAADDSTSAAAATTATAEPQEVEYEEVPFTDRQRALTAYLFTCECDKCAAQR